jgi:diaminopimelate epimerase
MIWNFTKMHGAGNDFVVLDGVRQPIEMTPERARALADRHFGVGADQILLVEAPHHPEADFRYRVFNADGGEVEHCGNGARCFVRFVHEQGLSGRNPLRAEICTGLITLTQDESGQVEVEMGSTRFAPDDVAFDATGLQSTARGTDTVWTLPLFEPAHAGQTRPGQTHPTQAGTEQAAPAQAQARPGQASVDISLVAVSNPHAVMVVDDVDNAPVAGTGPLVESHWRFAQRVNVGFMQVVDRHTIGLRVYERGAGETLACGTGACAAVAAGVRRGLLSSPVSVHTRGGTLRVAFDGSHLVMGGPATSVFSGQIDIDALLTTSEKGSTQP